MSLEWYFVIAIGAFAGVLWLMWLDRPKKTGTPPAPRYVNGCGAAARFCESHTCRCAWPNCDGYSHVCMCGADWFTDPREKENA